jgi:hypothetical protein
MRCAVQVPEHIAPRQVPDPDVALRWPESTARLMPLVNVTLMMPASATWPDAVITALDDSTLRLLMPIETLVPLGQATRVEAICTFHWPCRRSRCGDQGSDQHQDTRGNRGLGKVVLGKVILEK